MIELNRMTAIKEKLDALMSRLSNHTRRVHVAHEVETIEGGEQKCIAGEGLAHEGPY